MQAVVVHTCHGHRYLCPGQEKNPGDDGVRGWVQGSTSSPTGIGSRWRVV